MEDTTVGNMINVWYAHFAGNVQDTDPCAFQLIDLTEILALSVAVDQEIRAVQSAEYAGIAQVKKAH